MSTHTSTHRDKYTVMFVQYEKMAGKESKRLNSLSTPCVQNSILCQDSRCQHEIEAAVPRGLLWFLKGNHWAHRHLIHPMDTHFCLGTDFRKRRTRLKKKQTWTMDGDSRGTRVRTVQLGVGVRCL